MKMRPQTTCAHVHVYIFSKYLNAENVGRNGHDHVGMYVL